MTEWGFDQAFQQWDHRWRSLGLSYDSRPIFEKLWKEYKRPERHYHSLEHIRYGLELLREHQRETKNLFLLEFAWWFHDYVYHFHSRPAGLPSNELLSAQAADDVLHQARASMRLRDLVFGYIDATHHVPGSAKTTDQMLMADVDWSPLGLPWREFEKNGKKIRLEYPYASEEGFKKGRRKFLEAARRHSPEFYLPSFQNRYAEQLRSNLERELQNLGALV